MNKQDIAKTANNLLKNYNSLPIDIDRIITDKGIKISSYDFGENISGVLIVEKGSATIGYNKNEARVRNRFTMAHELGHYELHKGKDLFVDKFMFRSAVVDEASQIQETEANEFAACILMPRSLLEKEIEKLDFDCTDDNAIKKLASKFEVSTIAMSIRLSKLSIVI